jgi:lipoyl(octanoyl) transferase
LAPAETSVRDWIEMDELWVSRFHTVPYEWAREIQAQLAAARQRDTVPDLLLLLEHPAVYTRGRRSQPAELPMGEDWYRAQGIEVCDTDRGGAVTYHGPGQLVAYPIVSLRQYGDDVHGYVRRLERVMIETLGGLGIESGTREGLTGVWTGGRKIGSIGVHISRGVTTHGLAINVNNDLQPFEWIVPCGIEGAQMTSVSRELGGEQNLDELASRLSHHFATIFERRHLEVSAPDVLAQAIPMGEITDAFASLP